MFSLKKERCSDSRYPMDEPGGHDAQGHESVTEGQIPGHPTSTRPLVESDSQRHKVDGERGVRARGTERWRV